MNPNRDNFFSSSPSSLCALLTSLVTEASSPSGSVLSNPIFINKLFLPLVPSLSHGVTKSRSSNQKWRLQSHWTHLHQTLCTPPWILKPVPVSVCHRNRWPNPLLTLHLQLQRFWVLWLSIFTYQSLKHSLWTSSPDSSSFFIHKIQSTMDLWFCFVILFALKNTRFFFFFFSHNEFMDMLCDVSIRDFTDDVNSCLLTIINPSWFLSVYIRAS